jgi:hypothetical protein
MCSIEIGIRLTLWMQQRCRPATAADIQEKFGVSRATSYRWLAMYLDTSATTPTTATSPLTGFEVIAAPVCHLRAVA